MSSPEPLTSGQFRAALAALGVGTGNHVGIGASLKAVGPIEGQPATSLLSLLLEAVGPSGTLLAPAFSPKYPLTTLWLGRVHDVYDPAASPITTGGFPRQMHAWPGAIRSRHPTNSYVAIGAAAQQLLGAHDHREGAYEPYRRLAKLGGVLLSIGIGDVFPAARHLPQIDAGLVALVPQRYGAIYRDASGWRRIFARTDIGGCVTKLPLLVGELRAAGLLREARVGRAHAIACEATIALEHMTAALKARPQDYLCHDPSCLWCREVERRLPVDAGPRRASALAWRFYNAIRRREPVIDSLATPWIKRCLTPRS